jgi:hypothetical protein
MTSISISHGQPSEPGMDATARTVADMTLVLVCAALTLLGLFAVVAMASQVRDSARRTVLSTLRLAAMGIGYVFVALIYACILAGDGLEKVWLSTPWTGHHQQPPQRGAHKRSDSDVSYLDLGEAQYCLEKGLGWS